MLYYIVRSADFESFKRAVRSRLQKGWITAGGIAVTNVDGVLRYHQALIQDDEE